MLAVYAVLLLDLHYWQPTFKTCPCHGKPRYNISPVQWTPGQRSKYQTAFLRWFCIKFLLFNWLPKIRLTFEGDLSHLASSFIPPISLQVSFDLAEYTANVDGVGTLRLLDAIKTCGLTNTVKFYQASTSELYGKVQEIPQTETTPFYPRSPYGNARWCKAVVTMLLHLTLNIFPSDECAGALTGSTSISYLCLWVVYVRKSTCILAPNYFTGLIWNQLTSFQ